MGQTLGWFAGEFKRLEALLALLFSRTGAPGNALALSSQAQLFWFVNTNPAIGNDANDGLTSATPLLHIREIRRRWNGGILGVRPQLPANLYNVTIVGDVPVGHEFEDPVDVLWDLDASPGMRMVISFVPTVKRTGTILAVPHAFSRTATGEQTVTDAGVADWTSDVDHLLAVTTGGKATVCWVSEALAGPARGVLTSAYDNAEGADPSAIYNLGLVPDTVAPADTYEVLTLARCYFGASSQFRTAPGAKDAGSTSLAAVVVVNGHGLSQAPNDILHVEGDAQGNGLFGLGAAVSFVNCQIDQMRQLDMGGVGWFNCFFPAAGNANSELLGGPDLLAVQLSGYSRRFSSLDDNFIVDQDHFMIGHVDYFIGDESGATNGCILGDVGHFLHGGAPINIFFLGVGAQVEVSAFYNAQGVIYGQTGGAELVGMGAYSKFGSPNTSAAATFVTDGGAAAFFMLPGGASKVVYFDIATSTFLPVGGLAPTIGNLDTARPAGLGDVCQEPDRGVHITFGGLF